MLLAAADAEPGTAGGEVLRNLAGAGFTGALHAVLAAGEAPAGVATARTIADVPGDVELAVLALAPRRCPRRRRARAPRAATCARSWCCWRAAARSTPISSSRPAAPRGMRLVGPHCLGVVNTDPAVALDATFAPARPAPGRVAFAAQSGAFGIAALDLAAQRGVGLSSFVSMGAKADLSGNDLLQYWEADDGTDVVLLYLESFGNPRRFGQVARRVTADKPVIAVKSGRAPAAPRPDSSQTGRLLAASDTHVDALFRHAGVIRTDTLGEMFDLAGLLVRQPLPRGDRVAVVTNAGGLGVQCADACAAAGLRVTNPVDVSAAAGAADYERALASVLADPGVDAVIVLFARSLATPAAAVAAVVDAAGSREQPILAVFMGADAPPPLAAGATGAPRFAAPEEAVRALRRALEHARRLARPPDDLVPARGSRFRSRGGDRRHRPGRGRRLVAARSGRGAAALLRPPHCREPRGDHSARRRACGRAAGRRRSPSRPWRPGCGTSPTPERFAQASGVRRPSSAPPARCSTRRARTLRARGSAGPGDGGRGHRAAPRASRATRASGRSWRSRRAARRQSWSATSRSGWRRSAPRRPAA